MRVHAHKGKMASERVQQLNVTDFVLIIGLMFRNMYVCSTILRQGLLSINTTDSY